MAKGELRAEEMFDNETNKADTIDRKTAIKLMRKFAMQENKLWQKHCDKWEKAYAELLKETEI